MKGLSSGVYQFSLPYIAPTSTHLSPANHPVSTVDIELHIGRKEDLSDGILASILSFSTHADPNHIETIFSLVWKLWISNQKYEIPPEKVRLIEVHTKSRNLNDWHEIQMNWDHQMQHYQQPIWRSIHPDSWFYKLYQEKIHSYAWSAIEHLQSIPSTTSKSSIYTIETLIYKQDTPFWLLKVLKSTDIYLQTEHIPIKPIRAIKNSLKRLVHLEFNSVAYLPEITNLLVSEIHKLPTVISPDHYICSLPKAFSTHS